MKKRFAFFISIITACVSSLFISACDSKKENVQETITISGESQLCIGDETKLNATLSFETNKNENFVWVSSNDLVAKVNNVGTVSGISKGEVTISASFQKDDGSFLIAYHKMNIIAPFTTEIILNETNLELNYNETYQLKATVIPANSLQGVVWTTSDEEIVSVTKNGLVQAKEKSGSALVTATSLDGKKTEQCNVKVVKEYETTVFIYMCGSDLESKTASPGFLNSGVSGYASMDLQEMISVENKPDSVKIVVETGGTKKWALPEINHNYIQRWEIEPHNLVFKKSVGKSSMGKSSTLQNFLEWGFENYKSKKYGLILWDHGEGLYGVCDDENFEYESLTHEKIYEAVKKARTNRGIQEKLNWIAYDACVMQVQDIADYNSFNFNYMLASQDNQVGYGYDYDTWLDFLYKNPSADDKTLLEKIGHSYILESERISDEENSLHFYSQSLIDLSLFSSYKEAFESFSENLNILLEDDEKLATLAISIISSKHYGLVRTNNFDIEDVLTRIKNNENFVSLRGDIEQIEQKLNDIIIFEEHGRATQGCGLSLYCPVSNYSTEYYSESNPLGHKTLFENWSSVAHKVFWKAISL